jgi:hypothetical protein
LLLYGYSDSDDDSAGLSPDEGCRRDGFDDQDQY